VSLSKPDPGGSHLTSDGDQRNGTPNAAAYLGADAGFSSPAAGPALAETLAGHSQDRDLTVWRCVG
jgi:hypothetical protein